MMSELGWIIIIAMVLVYDLLKDLIEYYSKQEKKNKKIEDLEDVEDCTYRVG